jgi:hypothetical protein
MRCQAQDARCGEPHKRIATQQRARIRQDKLGSLFLATSLEIQAFCQRTINGKSHRSLTQFLRLAAFFSLF